MYYGKFEYVAPKLLVFKKIVFEPKKPIKYTNIVRIFYILKKREDMT